MNDDLYQILLYILIIVVPVVLSGIKASQKAKAQGANTRPDLREEDDIIIPEKAPVGRFTPRPAKSLGDTDLIRYQQVVKQRQQDQERNKKDERDQRFATLFRDDAQNPTGDGGGTMLKDFDIKDAIIYSEIINRKYE
jgi:hypothetical protein